MFNIKTIPYLFVHWLLKFSISECGTTVLKDSSVQTFIMNGRPAGIEEWPWQGRLILDDMVRYCGVSLIHTKWALTAAHCLE